MRKIPEELLQSNAFCMCVSLKNLEPYASIQGKWTKTAIETILPLVNSRVLLTNVVNNYLFIHLFLINNQLIYNK